MEKMMRWLCDYSKEIDEAEVGRRVGKLNLSPLDILRVAVAIVDRRERTGTKTTTTEFNQKRKNNATDGDGDDDDDYEAAMLKGERKLEIKERSSSVSNISSSPVHKKLKTHVHVNGGTICSGDDAASFKEDRLRREKALKKPILDIETPDLPPSLKQGKKLDRGSSSAFLCSSFSPVKKKRSVLISKTNNIGASYDSLSKQERLKREKLLKKPMISIDPPQPQPKPKPTKEAKKPKYSNKEMKMKLAQATKPDLPDDYRKRITEMGGTQIQLVIQKPLYKTDINHNHNRLSMPLTQINAVNFLTEEESAYLSKQSKGSVIPWMDVELIDTRLRVGTTKLKKWNLKKDTGKVNPMYVLASTWNDLVDDNNLKCDNIVQVWSFRVESELRFALVLVGEGEADQGSSEGNNTEIGSSSTTTTTTTTQSDEEN